jgi:hypothetical protein
MQDTRDLLTDAAERGIRYLQLLDARAVVPDPAAVVALDAFDKALPDAGADGKGVSFRRMPHA